MHRVFSLGGVVPLFVARTTFFQEAEFTARHLLGLSPDTERTKEIATEAHKLLCEAADSQNHRLNVQICGLTNMQHIMNCYKSHFELFEGVESILWGMITATWTAFEVVSEDLYECARKCRPSYIKKIKNPNFRRLSKIRETYQSNLRDTNIDAALSNESIEALSILRNISVHKGGIADELFIKDTSKSTLLSVYSQLKSGDKIEIDGNIVRKLVDNSIQHTLNLAHAVDYWVLFRCVTNQP